MFYGIKDYIVLEFFSVKFCDVLRDFYVDVVLYIILDCDYYEICLDLMKFNRKFY